jgi:heptosyltransferase-1
MRVLVVKTSSLGDVVHTLPALSDARRADPGLQFDWLVEEAFAPIPAWHHAVIQVIPVALRRWRKAPFSRQSRRQWHEFRHRIAAADYDLVIDAQGLLKSAWLARFAQGRRHGLDRDSAREGLAAMTYQVTHHVARGQHAIERVRQLFAAALGYTAPAGAPDYGLFGGDAQPGSRQLVFLHGTSWPSKLWPEVHWQEMIRLAADAGYRVMLPWGNAVELQRARRLAASHDKAEVTEAMDLNDMAGLLTSSDGVVATDTGLGHLAAAFSVPAVSLYGATDARLTGTRGNYQAQLQARFDCAPCLHRQCRYRGESTVQPACYADLPAQRVWQELQGLMNNRQTDQGS